MASYTFVLSNETVDAVTYTATAYNVSLSYAFNAIASNVTLSSTIADMQKMVEDAADQGSDEGSDEYFEDED